MNPSTIIARRIEIGLIAVMYMLSACTGRSANGDPVATKQSLLQVTPSMIQTITLGNQEISTNMPTPTVTSTIRPVVSTSSPTSAAPITHEEVVVMYDSVEKFTSVINRLDGLTGDEKAGLIAYIKQELNLRKKFTDQCIGLLSDEERAALDSMEKGSSLYQQANDKLEAAMHDDPACSSTSNELNALMNQYTDLLIKMKRLLAPIMEQ
jgi:hypothetical protein